ncbi:MAG: tRNA 2-thiouridine(34) synthase MnmA [Planctomycetota bacterium]
MRILAALSGGVDSAVAAARLVDEGHDVVAVHLRTGVEADGVAAGGARSCCGLDDARDARAVAAALGIPFHVVDAREAFSTVQEAFRADYEAGRTPLPCVLCNRDVKLGRLAEVAAWCGATAIATGHYARRAPGARGRWRLLAARDASKDQTYMLFRLDEAQRALLCFPLGDMTKAEVRADALRRRLPVHAKPDSQELCFLPADGGVRAWLRTVGAAVDRPGDVVEAGRVVARHAGALGFTRGQRHGLPALGARRYVTRVDAAAGVVEVAEREALLERDVHAHDVVWLDVGSAGELAGPVRVTARIRHAGPRAAGWLVATGPTSMRVRFDEPVFAPAAGQALVAYVGDAVLAGGTVELDTARQGPVQPGRATA